MKKIKFLLTFILLCGLTGYLFIMPQDYIIRFKSKTTPGMLFSGVGEWNLTYQKQDSFDYKITHKEPFKSINQTLHTISDIDLKIQWNFKSINDSTTLITAGITEEKHSVYNRITAPFSNTLFKRTSLKLIKDYKEGIEYQIKEKFKVDIIGVDSIPEITYKSDYNNKKISEKMIYLIPLMCPFGYINIYIYFN